MNLPLQNSVTIKNSVPITFIFSLPTDAALKNLRMFGCPFNCF